MNARIRFSSNGAQAGVLESSSKFSLISLTMHGLMIALPGDKATL